MVMRMLEGLIGKGKTHILLPISLPVIHHKEHRLLDINALILNKIAMDTLLEETLHGSAGFFYFRMLSLLIGPGVTKY